MPAPVITNATSQNRTTAEDGPRARKGGARVNRLRITLPGPLEVTAPDGELYVPQGHPRALLAALALRHGHPVPTGELVAALWDGTPPADAHTRVRACAERLRAALDPGGTGRRWVQETGDGYQLTCRDVEVHTDTFRSPLARAAGARERPTERALPGRAPEAWHGAALPGATSAPQHHTAAPPVPALHEERPRAEHRHGTLDPHTPAPVWPGCELPPEQALSGTPRADERVHHEALDTLFATGPSGTRRDVVVLHGATGPGRTALAVRWAHRARALFPDGRFYLDLRGRGPGTVLPSTATGTLLAALGLGLGQLPPTATARRALLRTALAGRRVLLLLDDAASAAQVRCLLPGPGPRVLVTSRLPPHGLPDAGTARLYLPDTAVALSAGAPGLCRTRHAPLT